ncbi:putative Outer membrane porin protein 32 [Sterolibacterium denitrificans]|uniref:Outer membrane porin protein 32 n=2 Tax=Sterolibacterium denitrificans TaxID=157592 RepID=A0A7Z7MW71_9PROT|nr:porin [Sterolibacterium denitrificans]KYC29401.1 hypothetical protein ACY05_02495 [Sterolibacterium denitrificans]SMB31336.1 putative Outer membrane porin protein 32 [Sterolibacterium denitrificans]
MQKQLITLAISGLIATGAQAQSNVTVYGVADLSFDSVSTSGGTLPGSRTGNYTRVSSNSSYLGFKGSEDLGNGLRALFQFESSVNVDTNTAGSSLLGAARDSYVGLETASLGTLKLGTLSTPTRSLGTAIDVNAGATSIGANSGLINNLGFDSRQANTIRYDTPVLAGFSAAFAYIAGENKTTDGAATPANRSAWDLGMNYKAGPWMAGLTHVQKKEGDAADTRFRNSRIATAYDFGTGSIRVLWNQDRDESLGASTRQTVWGLGGTFNATPNGKLIAQYYRANDRSGNATSDEGARLFELGYEHSLSKRTMLKLIYARIDNDGNATFNFGSNGVRNVTGQPGVDPRGLQIGVRHSF